MIKFIYFYIIKSEGTMSKLPSSLKSSFFNAFSNKSTTQQKKHYSLEFAESVQEISESLVGYIRQGTIAVISDKQLEVESMIYPVGPAHESLYNAHAWVNMKPTGKQIIDLLDVVSVVAKPYLLLPLDQRKKHMDFLKAATHSYFHDHQCSTFADGRIWVSSPRHNLYVGLPNGAGQVWKTCKLERQTYQANPFTAIIVKEENESKVMIAKRMLVLLKSLFTDGNDIYKSKLEVMSIQIEINEINEIINQGKKGKKEEYPLLEIHTGLKSLIDSIIQSTAVDKAESKENAPPPTDDKCTRERLQQLFLDQILPLLPKITLNEDLGETILALQKHGLLDLNNTDDYILKIMTEMANNPGLYSKDGLSSRICGFINTAHNSAIEPIIGLGSLKLARDNFLNKQIIQLMIKDIDLISSNNSAYIKILLKAVSEYDTLINNLDHENDAGNSTAGKTHNNDCGAGAGAKGKGPDFTENERKLLELASKCGINPTNQRDFLAGIMHKDKMLAGIIIDLLKEENAKNPLVAELMCNAAGVLFAQHLENERLRAQALDVPEAEAMAMADTGAALSLTQPTSQGNSEPSAPPMPNNNATPFQKEAGKSGKEAPEVDKSDGPS
jgi:hypothetical protein